VPPQFDPFSETTAGRLLQGRLDEFVARRPGLRIEVRVKAESGTSSMLNALAATKSAAPSITPDLVALSRPDLESATAKGLLHPFDGLTDLPEDSDWFPYARQIARIQNSTFGLPFAGDALALVGFRSPLPVGWTELPEGTLFIFPAADPRALFTLSLYLSAGGKLQDNQGQWTLNEGVLVKVLSLYLPVEENGVISSQVTNYETDEQAWTAFHEQRGNLLVSWASRYLNEETVPLALAPLPGLETGQYGLATGWSWALAGSNLENETLAVELAEFLSDSQFLAEWTQAAGYLPTRPKALSSWEDAGLQMVLRQTAESASLVPGDDLLVTVGPLFTQAALSVLSGEQLPSEAAQSVIEQLK
jgi:ABC-type glycerol-3-phosphate transport system substrate-binding protein